MAALVRRLRSVSDAFDYTTPWESPTAHSRDHKTRCGGSSFDTGGRFFYQRLVEYMSSGPMQAYILARDDAISRWRELMGPTKVFRARYTSPSSMRALYGLTDTRNTTHGSDSVESAHREIAFFFPEFNVREWMERSEPFFRMGHVEYDQQRRIHTVLGTA
ncbi:nucleoside diphosphate kinase 6 isoform X3 [Paramormyrops kingsleyae]|uniref:nucleoside diphosphate kinase 6 isoform X3 n=1 Tax=Paramormyrops kingsleyae TaxID=1676925 RepID=UPI003B96C861